MHISQQSTGSGLFSVTTSNQIAIHQRVILNLNGLRAIVLKSSGGSALIKKKGVSVVCQFPCKRASLFGC